MAGRISRSYSLAKASMNVLKQDKELLVFPLLSGVAMLLVTASFVGPLIVFAGGTDVFEELLNGPLGIAGGFLFYLVQYTIAFFFNTALVGCAILRMEGEDPTVMDGIHIALSKLGTIVGYAVLAATVGMALRWLSERTGWIGQIAVGLVGMAWNLATFLTIPILVTKDVSPLDAVRESASLFKRTWGEQVVGSSGISLIFGLATVALVLVGALMIAGAASIGPALVVPVVVLLGASLLTLMLVSTALQGIYSAALYRYAIQREPSGAFDIGLMESAFVPKKKGMRGF